LLTWSWDAGDHGEDVHEVDEAPRLGQPPQRPQQRRHARPALAYRHVHVVGDRGASAALPRPFLRLHLLDLPRSDAVVAVVIARQTGAVLDGAGTGDRIVLGGRCFRLGHVRAFCRRQPVVWGRMARGPEGGLARFV
jgi:hypothetical protein